MTIYYEESGIHNPSVIVFLHGGGVSGWMWKAQVDHFSANYHCIIPDLPGHGKSQTPEEKFTIQHSAQAVIKLIEDKVEGRPVTVIGFSLGAQVIIELLAQEPALIDYAVINSALTRPNPAMVRWIRPSVRLSFPLIRIRTFAKLQAKTLYVPPAQFERYYTDSNQMQLDTLVQILEANMSFAIPNSFHKAEARILITVGAQEKAIMKKSAAELVRCHANSQGIIIPHVGHGIMLARPDYFNKLVSDWLSEQRIPSDCIPIV